MYTSNKKILSPAFTLIELLVVVTIIVILAGVSVPVFNMVKEGADSSSSKAKLKSLGDLLAAYQGDNNGKPLSKVMTFKLKDLITGFQS